MSPDDRPLLAGWLTAASEMYDKPVSEAAMEVYWTLLKPFPKEAVDRAFKAHFADPDTGSFFPKPADVIRRITAGSEALAYTAWLKVLRAIKTHGASESIAFDDPLIHIAVDAAGGWVRLCMTNERDLERVRADFIRVHTAYRQTGARPAYSGVLYGRYDRNNVTLIGDPERARLTIDGGRVLERGLRVLPMAAVAALKETGAVPLIGRDDE